MITVAEALAHVVERAKPKPAVVTAIAAAQGLVLAEDVASDIDSPPYDKSIVDGYAVVAEDLRTGEARLDDSRGSRCRRRAHVPRRAGRGHADHDGRPHSGGGECRGDDRTNRGRARWPQPTRPGVRPRFRHSRRSQYHDARHSNARRGSCVAWRHALASHRDWLVGRSGPHDRESSAAPTVAILPTGNELVEPGETPSAGQIRNSNGPLLAAAIRQAGGEPITLPIARDDEADLRQKIATGLEHDVLVLSGGVSAGVLDLVPCVLAELGAKQVFHKVQLKPGKPLWFGVARRGDHETLVFGLPGNPVSSFVCGELFVRPAIERLSGADGAGLPRVQARLDVEYCQRGDRQTYLPGVLSATSEYPAGVRPVDWHGSADLRGLAAANVLIEFAAGDRQYAAGEAVSVLLLEGG